jgi:hypothetical protein
MLGIVTVGCVIASIKTELKYLKTELKYPGGLVDYFLRLDQWHKKTRLKAVKVAWNQVGIILIWIFFFVLWMVIISR